MRRANGGLVENEYRVLATILRAGGSSRFTIGELLVGLTALDPGHRLMNEATAYRITARFVEKGWLEQAWRLPEDDSRPRREFWLNRAGLTEARQALEAYVQKRPVAAWARIANATD